MSEQAHIQKPQADWVVTGAYQVVTCSPKWGGKIGVIEKGWVAGKGERILSIGSPEMISETVDLTGSQKIDASDSLILPGFVDSHTHLVFGGTRLDEYIANISHQSLDSLRVKGVQTGIMATVSATREASLGSLVAQSRERLKNMIEWGTTTIEIKSGYGFTTESEIKMLEAATSLEKEYPIDVIPTFLGAHGWDPDIGKNNYIDLLLNEMLPEVARRKLALFCDIWCEDSQYNIKECRQILSAAKSLGFKLKIHADAYSYIGGTDLAADLGAISADHLNYTPPSALRKLALAGTIGTVLPATDFSVAHARPFDPRPMREAGLEIAIGSNCCPGTCCESLPFSLILACRNHGMTPEEALLAVTLNGAKALGLAEDRGSLEVGKLADLQIWKTKRYEDIFYRFGAKIVDRVMKRGRIVVENGHVIPNSTTKLGS